jgi:cysteinyl-tRNA synthetase
MINKLLDDDPKINTPFVLFTNRLFLSLANTIGLLLDDLASFTSTEKMRHLIRIGLTQDALEKMIVERAQARKNKDYKTGDEIRNALSSMGILLQDSPKGTEWRIKHITIKGEG